MNTNVNMNNPSICIPKIVSSVTYNDINYGFQKLNIGKIDRIDIVSNYNSPSLRAFIHFEYWHNNERTNHLKNLIVNGKYFKLVYNFPWFWKCVLSNVPKPM